MSALNYASSDEPSLASRVVIDEDWTAGIGGGVWSTGVALALYFSSLPAHLLARLKRSRTCEFGSGNGYLASVLASAVEDCEIWVTDDEGHQDLMHRTVEKNIKLGNIKGTPGRVKIARLLWGEDDLGTKFDFIFGTDVVYRDHLHDPFIKALDMHLAMKGSALVGVCMSDTSPQFFTKLRKAG